MNIIAKISEMEIEIGGIKLSSTPLVTKEYRKDYSILRNNVIMKNKMQCKEIISNMLQENKTTDNKKMNMSQIVANY